MKRSAIIGSMIAMAFLGGCFTMQRTTVQDSTGAWVTLQQGES